MQFKNIERIDDYRIEIPSNYKQGMRTMGIIYVNRELEEYLEPQAIEQVANVATLPGIVRSSMAMPDVHTGYGFTIGGVAAFDIESGIISPGGVGYDINCGVKLIKTNLTKDFITSKMKDIVNTLYRDIPSGLGSKGKIKLTKKDYADIFILGAKWAVEQGFGSDSDLQKTESFGYMEGANPEIISQKAYDRGKAQQGTLGSGNHFLEIQYVDEIYDNNAANIMGLFVNQITVMIHSGSRGFGHQICTDFLETMLIASRKYGIDLPDKELACAPYHSTEGQDYFSTMKAAANYAWANRQCLTHQTREIFMSSLGISPNELGMTTIYEVAHNIAKIEEHIVNGKKKKLIVHRKGATRAFQPGHPELPEIYRDIGQPVIIPGDMGRASFILLGTEKAMQETFGSTCHGAGRMLSRHQAIKKAKGRKIWQEMEDRGIFVRSDSKGTLAEEMSEAYKDISQVVDVVHNVGISKKVARLKPLGVIKG